MPEVTAQTLELDPPDQKFMDGLTEETQEYLQTFFNASLKAHTEFADKTVMVSAEEKTFIDHYMAARYHALGAVYLHFLRSNKALDEDVYQLALLTYMKHNQVISGPPKMD
jgi:hypothetical protein